VFSPITSRPLTFVVRGFSETSHRPVRLRSSRKSGIPIDFEWTLGAASRPNGDKSPRHKVALALSRMADGVHLLVERALDHHEALAQAKV
jgi:hypothetical protein